ncbi:MAG TPA: hypothetical protein VHE55_12700 [Fimbriimonadaceae bacterium]|nr:hypothetical protein [Fimbriimonadaceae bacterium]
MAHLLDRTTTKALALDVRGTLIDPVHDIPMSPDLASSLVRLSCDGIKIGIVTATSLASLQTLIVPCLVTASIQLQAPHEWSNPFLVYVDSGTAAYSLDADGTPRKMAEYEFQSFKDEEVHAILKVLDSVCSRLRWPKPLWKVKPGQINFYCGSDWATRHKLAHVIKSAFSAIALHHVQVMVPTAKETIDIALSNKARPMLDLLHRCEIPPVALVTVGDSMQPGGADLDMFDAALGCVGVQVGEIQPGSDVAFMEGYGPERAYQILCDLLD